MSRLKRANVIIIHPDLGIGGAERLIIDVALALQNRGHKVTIYTSHRDRSHCFEEARDGTLDVQVRGNSVFPAHVGGRFYVLMAILRQLHLTVSLMGELGNRHGTSGGGSDGKNKADDAEEFDDDIFIVDQVPACVPFLKTFADKQRRQRGYDNRVQENVQYHRELDKLATGLGLQTATSKTVISALSVPESIDVLFLLSVPTAFRDTLLAQSKLLLYTPINEHFGIVPVEAMRAGIPVLASNTGGPLETIVEGETGWLRDAKKDADWTAVMDKVLYGMDRKELDRMSVAAKKRVEHEFSLTAMGDRLEEEISGMLTSVRRPFTGFQPIMILLALFGLALSVIVAFTLKMI
ncbi:Alpha-1,3-mannosyltransferase-like protein [Aspergillus hancockii]|nr:Alpha-1,3-mannosyltransferase-like protein [Aspergillus hancockii]